MTPYNESNPDLGHPDAPKPSVWDILRRRFIGGLITIIPAGITIWAIALLMGLIDGLLGEHLRPLISEALQMVGWSEKFAGPLSIGISLLISVGFVICIGILTRFLLVRRLIHMGEGIVARIPLVRFFYATPKEVIKILTSKKDSVKRVVLIEYPRKDCWAFAYATSECIHMPDGKLMVSVFMPSTPNPTTGFLMLVPADQVLDINMSTEDAMRMIISGGILSPNHYYTAQFAGMRETPNLPPSEPLTSEIPLDEIEFDGDQTNDKIKS